MSDIVWSINPAHDSLHDMMIRLKQFMSEVLESQDIEVHYAAPADLKSLKLDLSQRKELYLALKEIINNAAKYSGCKRFYFEITRQKGDIVILVRDDGKGMDQDKVTNGNGLKNIESRITQIGGTVSRESAPGKGVKYEIRTRVQ
jgi:two-component system, NarL family, sensor histidine kinase UhpB